MTFESRLGRILWEAYEDGCRRCETDLWRFAGPLYEWIEELLQHALPDDWRDRVGAYLDSWEPEGFEVEPDQRRDLEERIFGWAELHGLLPGPDSEAIANAVANNAEQTSILLRGPNDHVNAAQPIKSGQAATKRETGPVRNPSSRSTRNHVEGKPTLDTGRRRQRRYVPGMGKLLAALSPASKGFKVFFTLQFLPDTEAFKSHANATCCTEVNFVQIARVTINGGTAGNGWPWGFSKLLNQWFVDSLRDPPYYSSDSAGSPNFAAGAGMNDEPGPKYGYALLQNVSYEFETCIVSSKGCVDGSDKGVGDVFGAVKWGFSYTVIGPIWNRRVVAQKFYVNELIWTDAEAKAVSTTDQDGQHSIQLGGPNIGQFKSFVTPRGPSEEMAKVLSQYFQ